MAAKQNGTESLVKRCARSATSIPMQNVTIDREKNLSHTSSSSESETDLNRRKMFGFFKLEKRS